MTSKHYKDKGFSRGYMSTGKTVQELRELGEDVLQAAKDALAAGADEVMQEAKGRCPVYEGRDKRVRKGALRDSIKLKKLRGGTAYRSVPMPGQPMACSMGRSWNSARRSTGHSCIRPWTRIGKKSGRKSWRQSGLPVGGMGNEHYRKSLSGLADIKRADFTIGKRPEGTLHLS